MVRVKAKINFNIQREIKAGEIVELTEQEFSRFSHLVDTININLDDNSVNSNDNKLDKKYRKGINK